MSWRRIAIGLAAAACAAPARAELPVCDRPEELRFEIRHLPSELLDDSKKGYYGLVNELHRSLRKISSAQGLSSPEFAYLKRVKIKPEDGPDITGNDENEQYFDSERGKSALQTMRIVVASDRKIRAYTNQIFVGRGCYLPSCYFDDTKLDPPPQNQAWMKEYFMILTLYALGSNAAHSRCDEKIVKTLYGAALEKLDAFRVGNSDFLRMEELETEIESRVATYRRGVKP